MLRNNWKFFVGVALLIAAASTWGRLAGRLTPDEASSTVEQALKEKLGLETVDITVFSIEVHDGGDTVAARMFGRPVQLQFINRAREWTWAGVVREGETQALTVDDYVASVRRANEESAFAALQVINTAEVAARIRSGHYLDLPALTENGLLVWNVVENPPRGYRLELETTGDGYRVYAVPTRHPQSGLRSFYSDQGLSVRAADRRGGKASPDDPEFVP